MASVRPLASSAAAIVAAVAVAFASAAGVVGCSLLVSTSGLSGGGGGPADGAPADGGLDGTVVDGGASEAGSDAGTDADAADAAPVRFCDSFPKRPTFCTDFDGEPLSPTFDLYGAPALDVSRFVSAPRSLRGVVAQGASDRSSAVRKNFGVAADAVDGTFKAWVTQFDPTKDIEIVNVQLERAGGGSCNVTLSVRDAKWTMDEYCVLGNGTPDVNVVHRADVALVLARWTTIAFSFRFSPTRTFSLKIDGTSIFDEQPLAAGTVNGPASVVAGLNFVQTGAGRAEVNVDDLAVDLR